MQLRIYLSLDDDYHTVHKAVKNYAGKIAYDARLKKITLRELKDGSMVDLYNLMKSWGLRGMVPNFDVGQKVRVTSEKFFGKSGEIVGIVFEKGTVKFTTPRGDINHTFDLDDLEEVQGNIAGESFGRDMVRRHGRGLGAGA